METGRQQQGPQARDLDFKTAMTWQQPTRHTIISITDLFFT